MDLLYIVLGLLILYLFMNKCGCREGVMGYNQTDEYGRDLCDDRNIYNSGAVGATCHRYNNNCEKCGNHCGYYLNKNDFVGDYGLCSEGPRPPPSPDDIPQQPECDGTGRCG